MTTAANSLENMIEQPYEGYSPPDDPKPLGGYAILMATFTSLSGLFALWFRRSGRELPDHMSAEDLALVTVASHKAARIITKDKVTAVVRAPFTRYEAPAGPAEVSETARGQGALAEAIGELFTCPYCIGQWIASGLVALYVHEPRVARTVSSLFAVATGADYLQQAWVAVDKAA
jgi:hypothetical protein